MSTIVHVKRPPELTLRSKIMKSILFAIREKKGTDIVSLNLKKIPQSVSDYFILCSATNHIQLKAIADYIEETVWKECGQKPYKTDGHKGQQWIVLDYIDIVIHCMLPELRNTYNLEELWHDAQRKEHNIQ